MRVLDLGEALEGERRVARLHEADPARGGRAREHARQEFRAQETGKPGEEDRRHA